jgi:hypothetical protein
MTKTYMTINSLRKEYLSKQDKDYTGQIRLVKREIFERNLIDPLFTYIDQLEKMKHEEFFAHLCYTKQVKLINSYPTVKTTDFKNEFDLYEDEFEIVIQEGEIEIKEEDNFWTVPDNLSAIVTRNEYRKSRSKMLRVNVTPAIASYIIPELDEKGNQRKYRFAQKLYTGKYY